MNIFCTDDDPFQSALALDDVRVNKMSTESAQMLSTAINETLGHHVAGLYKSVSRNHPCNIWARSTRQNFLWLFEHGLALTFIFAQTNGTRHAARSIILNAYELRHVIPEGPLEPFMNATEYKGWDYRDVTITQLYRDFMNLKWTTRDKKPPTWRLREKPEWAKV